MNEKVINNTTTAEQAALEMDKELKQETKAEAAAKTSKPEYQRIADTYDWGAGNRDTNMSRYIWRLWIYGYVVADIHDAAQWVYDNLINDHDSFAWGTVENMITAVQLKHRDVRIGSAKHRVVDSCLGNLEAANNELHAEVPYVNIIGSGDNYKYSIDIARLAEYIRNNHSYYIVGGTLHALVYWRVDGVYKLVSENWIKGLIAQLIEDTVDKSIISTKTINDVYMLLVIAQDRLLHDAAQLNDVSNIINYRNGVLIYDHNTERFFRTRYEKTAVEYIKLDEKEEVYTGSNVKYKGQVLKMPIGYAVEHDKTIYNYDQLDDVLKQLGINYIPTSQIPCDYHKRDLCTTADVDAFCNASEVYDDCKCPIFLGFLNQLAGMPVMPKNTADDDMMQAALARCIPMTQGGAAGINTYADAVQLKRLLLTYYGLALSGVEGYRLKRMLMLIGAGNTGKSQYVNLLCRLLGLDNCAEVSLYSLSSNRFAMAEAMDKALIYDADVRAMRLSDLSIIKNITGGDRIAFEKKGRDPQTSVFKGCMLVCANQLPLFSGDNGDHVYDRFIVIPCNNVVEPSKRDPYITDKMMSEAPAIIALAIAALREQEAIGLNKIKLPACCIDAVNNYKEENDPVITFLRDCTERRTGEPDVKTDKEYSRVVYAAYKDWAQREGIGYIASLSQFKASAKNYYGGNILCKTKAPAGNSSYFTFTLTAAYTRYVQQQSLTEQHTQRKYY